MQHTLIRHRNLLFCALLFTIGFLVYANTLGHGFVYDDQAVLNNNEFVKKGIDGLPEIFSTGSWLGFNPERNLHIYRPLQLAVLALQYELFELNPFGYHLVHVLSYCTLCSLCYLLLNTLFSPHPHGTYIAAVAGLLFTIHPVHTEVAANIKGNGDLLSMLFGVVALLLIQRYSHTKKLLTLSLSTLSFLAALFFKETAVTTIGIAALLLYFFSNLKIKSICLALTPMLLSVLFYLWMRSLVFGTDANSLDGTTTNISNVILMADGWSQQIGLRMYALGKNLQLTLFPYPLQMMYVYDSIPMVEAYEIESLLPFTIYCTLTILFFIQAAKRSILGFSIGLYLISIFLFSNFIFSIPNIISERWLLMPSLGSCIAISCFFVWAFRQHRAYAIILASLFCFGYTGYTIQRNFAWKSNLTLALTDVVTAPKNYNVLRMAGSQLFAEAKTNEMNPKMLRDSAHYMEATLRITPYDAKRRNTLGIAYEQLGEYNRAALEFEKAMQKESKFRDKARYSYAKNQVNAGNYLRALFELKNLEIDYPKHAGVKSLKGTALKVLGKQEDALNSFKESLKLNPNDPRANRSLGAFYLEEAKANNFAEKSVKQSIKHHEKWLNHFDGTPKEKALAYNTLGQLHEQIGAHVKAAKAFILATSTPSSIYAKAKYSAANNYSRARDFNHALPIWVDLKSEYPNEVGVHIGKCIALIATQANFKQIHQCANDLLKLLSTNNHTLKPDQAAQLNKIAIAIEKERQYVLAASLFAEASKHDSSIKGKAAFSSAKNYHTAGQFENALKQWNLLEEAYPSVIEVLFRKATTLEAMGKIEPAKAVYAEVLRATGPEAPEANEADYLQAKRLINKLNQ